MVTMNTGNRLFRRHLKYSETCLRRSPAQDAIFPAVLINIPYISQKCKKMPLEFFFFFERLDKILFCPADDNKI